MKLTPLTSEQQALCVQWRPYAHKLAWRYKSKSPHLSDVIDSLVGWALVGAARNWRPADGTFVTCLHQWVRSIYGPMRVEAGPNHESLYRQVGEDEGLRLVDMVRDESTRDVSDDIDAASLMLRCRAELPGLIQSGETTRAEMNAHVSANLFLRALGGEQVASMARELGVTPQSAAQRIDRARVAFDRWAASIRAEAA